MRHATILAVVLLLAVPSFAQSPSLRENVQVTVIEVPVTVQDRNGDTVRNLTKSNFEIYDEGKKRDIEYFDVIDLAKPQVNTPEQPLSPLARRHFMLLFDLSYSSPESLSKSRDAAGEFVDKGMREEDFAAVGTISAENGFAYIVPFTGDRKLLHNAIDTLGSQKFFHTVDPLHLLIDYGPSAGGGTSTGGVERRDRPDPSAELSELNRMATRENDEIQRARIRNMLGKLDQLANVLNSVSGRKEIILLSEGFDARLVQGRDSGAQANLEDTEAIINGETWKVDTDQRYGNSSSLDVLKQFAEIFKRTDVVLHAIDIRGLRVNSDAREGSTKISNDSLFLLSNSTGGQLFKNANNLSQNFDQLLKQQEVVYVLAFSAQAGKSGKFHNLKVKLVNAPSGSRLSARSGYYEPSDKVSGLQAAFSTAEILTSDIAQRDIPMSLFASSFPVYGENPITPVVLEIDGKSMIGSAKGNSISSELYVYAFDKNNAVAGFAYQRMGLDLTKVRDQLAKQGVKFYANLNLPPGDYAIKALLKTDASGKNGFARTNVVVPDFRKAAMAPPAVFDESTSWLMVKASPKRQAELNYPFRFGAAEFIPAAAAHVVRNREAKLALFTWNMSSVSNFGAALVDESGAQHVVTLQPTNLSAIKGVEAAVAGSSRLNEGLNGCVKRLFTIKPGTDLSPGRYLLVIKGGDQSSSAPVVIE